MKAVRRRSKRAKKKTVSACSSGHGSKTPTPSVNSEPRRVIQEWQFFCDAEHACPNCGGWSTLPRHLRCGGFVFSTRRGFACIRDDHRHAFGQCSCGKVHERPSWVPKAVPMPEARCRVVEDAECSEAIFRALEQLERDIEQEFRQRRA